MKFKVLWAAAAVVALSAGAAAAQSGGPVKIGVLNDMSGLYADIGGKGSVEAAKMAAEDAGNVLGQPVQVISGDHQNKPDIGANIARQWYDTDGVDVITDVPTSSVALAINEVSREKKKLALWSGPASSDLTGPKCNPYAASWVYDTYALAHVTGSAVVKSGGDSWFFVTADYAFGHALERDTAAVVKAAGGKVVGDVNVPLSTPFLVLPAAGAVVQGQDHRPRQRRRRHDQLDQAGRRVRHRRRRPEIRRSPDVHHRRP